MVEEIMNLYHVAYQRDESGWWVASVREVRGCHTQGRTVDEARRRIREAMELFVDALSLRTHAERLQQFRRRVPLHAGILEVVVVRPHGVSEVQ